MTNQKMLLFLLKVNIVAMEVPMNLLKCGLTMRTLLLSMNTLTGVLSLRRVMEMVLWLPSLALETPTSSGTCTTLVQITFTFGRTMLQRNVSSSLVMEIHNLKHVTQILSNSLRCTLLDPVHGALQRDHGQVSHVQSLVVFPIPFPRRYNTPALLPIP